ncbi:endonuclease domain-containing protein [Ramlibacter rhizophilus]|uniref:Endonuclease domain-containing protein n=1 Tax=Ramlibacter rhizophilus TaxID=1781167 RepID=A0A4Z0BP26_9BURK|nr:DUF559 domain-containing protein [Ramlibacter rhizophilus]TFY99698.1 endonuclease domain-containing protein [Ramlibacter rhizophilus]
MQSQATAQARQFARELRKAMTDAERRLWSRLRGNQLGFRFRRQHPVGPFIADFACLDPQLVVELDGSQHAQQTAYDQARDAFLRSRGFAVLRFPCHEPLRHCDGVLETITSTLASLAGAAPSRIKP